MADLGRSRAQSKPKGVQGVKKVRGRSNIAFLQVFSFSEKALWSETLYFWKKTLTLRISKVITEIASA